MAITDTRPRRAWAKLALAKLALHCQVKGLLLCRTPHIVSNAVHRAVDILSPAHACCVVAFFRGVNEKFLGHPSRGKKRLHHQHLPAPPNLAVPTVATLRTSNLKSGPHHASIATKLIQPSNLRFARTYDAFGKREDASTAYLYQRR